MPSPSDAYDTKLPPTPTFYNPIEPTTISKQIYTLCKMSSAVIPPSDEAALSIRDLKSTQTSLPDLISTITLDQKAEGDVIGVATGKMNDTKTPTKPEIDGASKIVQEYLLEHSPEFKECLEYRDRGWVENKEKGDAYFAVQKDRADNADVEGRKHFHRMMIQIAAELQDATRAFDIVGPHLSNVKVLDICCAPGGYSQAILNHNPRAMVYGISLSKDKGGHPLIMDMKDFSGFKDYDVTLLVKEFTDKPVPDSYPKDPVFIPMRPFNFHKFELVFCDGKVLRTHNRPKHREELEATRLVHSELILAMQRIRPGGNLIMLMHKADHWSSCLLLYTFSKFANIQLFKPAKKHATRSSFYLVAKDIHPESEAGQLALQAWREVWWNSTFGGEDERGVKQHHEEPFIRKVLEEFGDRLVELGRRIWKIQAGALSHTDWAGQSSVNTWTPTQSSPTVTENTPSGIRVIAREVGSQEESDD